MVQRYENMDTAPHMEQVWGNRCFSMNDTHIFIKECLNANMSFSSSTSINNTKFTYVL